MSREGRVKFMSSDNEMFEVDESIVRESKTLTLAIELCGTETPIPVPNVAGRILAKIIEYWKYHWESQQSADGKPVPSEDAFKQWEAEFVNIEEAMLSQIMKAADYLDTKNLLGLTLSELARLDMGKLLPT